MLGDVFSLSLNITIFYLQHVWRIKYRILCAVSGSLCVCAFIHNKLLRRWELCPCHPKNTPNVMSSWYHENQQTSRHLAKEGFKFLSVMKGNFVKTLPQLNLYLKNNLKCMKGCIAWAFSQIKLNLLQAWLCQLVIDLFIDLSHLFLTRPP